MLGGRERGAVGGTGGRWGGAGDLGGRETLRNGGPWGTGDVRGTGGRWGTVGRRGDDDVLTHILLKILHSFHYAAAMLMSCTATHSDVSLIPVCAVTQ